MPFYDYRCKECDKVVTEQKKMTERNDEPNCPLCKKRMSKVISSIPSHYKGDGFTGARKAF